jgi:hypothetical protein
MAAVWIIGRSVPHEGDTVLGVEWSEAAAVAEARRLGPTATGGDEITVCRWEPGAGGRREFVGAWWSAGMRWADPNRGSDGGPEAEAG